MNRVSLGAVLGRPVALAMPRAYRDPVALRASLINLGVVPGDQVVEITHADLLATARSQRGQVAFVPGSITNVMPADAVVEVIDSDTHYLMAATLYQGVPTTFSEA